MFAAIVPYFTGVFGHVIEVIAIVGFAVGLGYTVYFIKTKGK